MTKTELKITRMSHPRYVKTAVNGLTTLESIQRTKMKPRKVEALALSFISSILITFCSIVGCSDMPYTGSVLTTDTVEVDQYMMSPNEELVCLQNGTDSECLTLIPKPKEKEKADSINGPIIHIHPEELVYIFYHKGEEIVRVEKAMDTTNIAETLTETKADPQPQAGGQAGGTGTVGDDPAANNNPDDTQQPDPPPPPPPDDPSDDIGTAGNNPNANNNPDDTLDPPPQTTNPPGGTGTTGNNPNANNNPDDTPDPPPPVDPPDDTGTGDDDPPDDTQQPRTPPPPPPPPQQTTNQPRGNSNQNNGNSNQNNGNSNQNTNSDNAPDPPPGPRHPTPNAIYYDHVEQWNVTIYYPENYKGPRGENGDFGFSISSSNGTIGDKTLTHNGVRFPITIGEGMLYVTVAWDTNPAHWEGDPPSRTYLIQARPAGTHRIMVTQE